MSTQHQVLLIGEQYLAQIMEIERESFEHPWSASLMKDSILSAHTQSWGLFDNSNKLIAFTIISVIFDEAEILDFSVAKTFQGKGFGQKLLSYIMNHLSYKGVEKLFLELRESNVPAVNIYKKYHFKKISMRKNYYRVGDSYEDALVLQANLQPVVNVNSG